MIPVLSVLTGRLHAVPPRTTNPKTSATPGRAYEAKNLLVLEGLEAVRKRPAMYIGTTDTRGLMHCLWEIIDNAVDEALAGFGEQIDVLLGADGSIQVTDRGRGVPVDVEPRTGLVGVEVVFTKLHAGGKFGTGDYNATGGLHGVGASVVNALSSRLDVEVDRNGATWGMSFRRGVPGFFEGDGPDAGFTAEHGLRKVGKVARGVTGTRVVFSDDPAAARAMLGDLAAALRRAGGSLGVGRARRRAIIVVVIDMSASMSSGLAGEPGVMRIEACRKALHAMLDWHGATYGVKVAAR